MTCVPSLHPVDPSVPTCERRTPRPRAGTQLTQVSRQDCSPALPPPQELRVSSEEDMFENGELKPVNMYIRFHLFFGTRTLPSVPQNVVA